MSEGNILIFGPTGQVGSAVARSIHDYTDANVHLAMRDVQKSIPGLSADEEEKLMFQRIEADLTKTDTVKAAVERSGAKGAFIYNARGTSDHMRGSLEAMKSAGLEFIVFLSSAAILDDIRSVSSEQFIAWTHAQVEINLEEVFGRDSYVAVRPEFFASNAFWWKKMIAEGEVKLMFPDAKMDWITPEDIGRVSAAVLANSSKGGGDILLYGPQLLSFQDAIHVIGRAVDREIRIVEVDEVEGLKVFVHEIGLPEFVGKLLIAGFKRGGIASSQNGSIGAYEEAAGNVLKYAKRHPMRFEDWVKAHVQDFKS